MKTRKQLIKAIVTVRLMSIISAMDSRVPVDSTRSEAEMYVRGYNQAILDFSKIVLS